MFTVKFISIYGDVEETTTAVSCPHYSAYRMKNGAYEIVLYKDFTSCDGVAYFLSSEDIGRPYYQVCYVENQTGKTIETFRPTNNSKASS